MMLFEESLLSSIPAGTTVGSEGTTGRVNEAFTVYRKEVRVQRIQTPSKQNGTSFYAVTGSHPTL